jgi:hypothetical protein
MVEPRLSWTGGNWVDGKKQLCRHVMLDVSELILIEIMPFHSLLPGRYVYRSQCIQHATKEKNDDASVLT